MRLDPSPLRIVFMGTPGFAVPSLTALIGAALDRSWEVVGVVTQPDRRSGRGRQVSISPVKEVALAHEIPLLQPRSLRREPDAVEALAAWAPDLMVVAAFGQILRPRVLELPTFGCINVHASLLPAYRGASPIPAAILNGDTETGISIMLMDEGMDTGPLLAQDRLSIQDDEDAEQLSQRLAETGAGLLLRTLPDWLAGEISPIPQTDLAGEPSTCGLIRREDGEIDWRMPARHIERMTRAYIPWPGAYSEWQGLPLKIRSARVLDAAAGSPSVPGQVITQDGQVVVVTGEGLLQPIEVQPPGKRPMAFPSFLNGAGRTFPGSILGRSADPD